MTRTQLKFLACVYIRTSKELDSLKGDYENAVIDEEVVKTVKESLKQDAALIPVGNQEQLQLLAFVSKAVTTEILELRDKAYKAKIKIDEYDTKVQKTYLEAKLNAIKPMLGDSIVKKIEDSEIEHIIKSEILKEDVVSI